MTTRFPDLMQGEIINNDRLMQIFGCSGQGGMRRAHKTNSLVLVSNNVKSLYTNRWDGEILHYTGMGAIGDQTLGTQNKTLAESGENGVKVYLFEVFEEQKYTFRGKVALMSAPYKGRQNDTNGEERDVWMFPLGLVEQNWNPPEAWVMKSSEQKEGQARRISNLELVTLAEQAHSKPSKRITSEGEIYVRDPYVKELSLRMAEGICQLCELNAPFQDNKGKPFLESHHIEWLSRGGKDKIENVIGLCPNCHRKMHILDLEEDVKKLKVRNGLLLRAIDNVNSL